ncbi:hypothetical protein KBY88_05295 [Cyanobium sp. Morenito 9A2]|nr:hypothetical protein [Cyanobium sp. Morenito 9A2]
MPTASDSSLGSGKWSAGPAALAVYSQGPWVAGALLNNVWSFAGASDRGPVSAFLLQPFINYNRPNGWYLVTSPIITANWQAAAGQQWIVPVGGGVERLFRVGGRPINASLQAYANVLKPTNDGDVTIRAQVQFLFPQREGGPWVGEHRPRIRGARVCQRWRVGQSPHDRPRQISGAAPQAAADAPGSENPSNGWAQVWLRPHCRPLPALGIELVHHRRLALFRQLPSNGLACSGSNRCAARASAPRRSGSWRCRRRAMEETLQRLSSMERFEGSLARASSCKPGLSR